MVLNKTAFGRHETFPLRYGWLSKGISAAIDNEDIFRSPEQAMMQLGIGRNMVNALHYWLQAAKLVIFMDGKGIVTPLGHALLGEKGDPYLEDEATLWIIHWLIVSNVEFATGFFWFFNHYSAPRFRDKDVLQALEDFVEQELGLRRAHTTLKSDISTLLRMYSPVAGRGGEEHLDSPLASLQLVNHTEEGYGYSSLRTSRPFLPTIAMHFALQQRFADYQGQQAVKEAAIPVRDLLYGGNGLAAPGAAFRLNEEGLMACLHQMMDDYPSYYALRDTAGINQLYRLTPPQQPDEVLFDYYQGGVA
ncbi:DUF4007 family protein [Thiofilum flexile]|uniref:DUF4007 family protein n=1 Tax=Thiofilum flexile TaxID=125627 RepID=UPI00036FACDF|nr:DUF4007 family protein [Thiofilum flexile]